TGRRTTEVERRRSSNVILHRRWAAPPAPFVHYECKPQHQFLGLCIPNRDRSRSCPRNSDTSSGDQPTGRPAVATVNGMLSARLFKSSLRSCHFTAMNAQKIAAAVQKARIAPSRNNPAGIDRNV